MGREIGRGMWCGSTWVGRKGADWSGVWRGVAWRAGTRWVCRNEPHLCHGKVFVRGDFALSPLRRAESVPRHWNMFGPRGSVLGFGTMFHDFKACVCRVEFVWWVLKCLDLCSD